MADPRDTTITIANGQTDSAALLLEDLGARHSFDVQIFAPATMPEAVTVQVSKSATTLAWSTLQSGGVDVALAAGKATAVLGIVSGAVRLHAGSAVGADRVFGWRAVARDTSR